MTPTMSVDEGTPRRGELQSLVSPEQSKNVMAPVSKTGWQQGQAKQQMDAYGRAQHFGHVGGHRRELRDHPTDRRTTGRGELVARHLGEVLARRNAQLGRERLDQHRHQVAGDHDPQQEIAELGAALNVGGEVPGVDVRDRGDEPPGPRNGSTARQPWRCPARTPRAARTVAASSPLLADSSMTDSRQRLVEGRRRAHHRARPWSSSGR